jgi:hypothetical protein
MIIKKIQKTLITGDNMVYGYKATYYVLGIPIYTDVNQPVRQSILFPEKK